MKKVIASLMILFALCGIAVANEATNDVTFQWNDSNTKVDPGYGWKLFMREDGGTYNYTQPVATINYVNGMTVFEATQPITISGNPGVPVSRYFVLRAFSGTVESGDSNEVTYTGIVPINAPYELKIKVTLN